MGADNPLAGQQILASGVGGPLLPRPKVLNKATSVPLTHVQDDKLNAHMGNMNSQGWELMSVAVEAVGIEEKFIMFWRKEAQ